MDLSRRSFLRTLPFVTVSVAGCVGSGETDTGSDDTPSETDATTDDDTPEATDTLSDDNSPPSESSYGLTVEPVSVETLRERFDVATLDTQLSSVKNAIQTAVSGRYETDAIGEELASFLAAHEFVFVEETYYSLEASLPQEVLQLSPVEEEQIDESEIVGGRRLRKNAIVADAVTEAAVDGETTRAMFPDLLSELVAEYEYVTPDPEDDENRDVYEWSLDSANGSPPYWVEATVVEETAVFGDELVEFESLSSDAQEELETALEAGHITLDESPAVLDEPSFQYVRIDGTIYSVAVSVGN